MTSIEWTHAPGYKGETWNPVTGCNKVSPGCANCYAEGVANRFWGDRKFSDVRFHADRLQQPLRWRKPRMVFVNSMSDLFHESVTDEQLDRIFAVMALTPQHIYQVLTKRPKRMLEYLGLCRLANRIEQSAKDFDPDNWPVLQWPLENCWLGVTVENQATADERIPLLLQAPAAVRFLSCEPLLESLDLSKFAPFCWERIAPEMTQQLLEDFGGPLPDDSLNAIMSRMRIDQVIIGGESGPKSRHCDIAWIRSLLEQCKAADVPAFVKQLGSRPTYEVRNAKTPGMASNVLEGTYQYYVNGKGGNPAEWPEDLRVREWPRALPLLEGAK